jgi:hypothetical protein
MTGAVLSKEISLLLFSNIRRVNVKARIINLFFNPQKHQDDRKALLVLF